MVHACTQRPTAKVLARRTLPKACGGKCVKPKVTVPRCGYGPLTLVRSQLQYGAVATQRPFMLAG